MINGHLEEWEVWIKNPVSNSLMPISIMGGTSLILRTASEHGNPVVKCKRNADNTHLYNAVIIYSQDESSEKFIGEWAEARGIRDQLFIATKVSFFSLFNAGGDHPTIVLNLLLFYSTLTLSRFAMNLSLKKYSTLGIVPNLCASL